MSTVKHQKWSQAIDHSVSSLVPSLLDFAHSIHKINKNDLTHHLFFLSYRKIQLASELPDS